MGQAAEKVRLAAQRQADERRVEEEKRRAAEVAEKHPEADMTLKDFILQKPTEPASVTVACVMGTDYGLAYRTCSDPLRVSSFIQLDIHFLPGLRFERLPRGQEAVCRVQERRQKNYHPRTGTHRTRW